MPVLKNMLQRCITTLNHQVYRLQHTKATSSSSALPSYTYRYDSQRYKKKINKYRFSDLPVRLVVMGPPGVGKGTIARQMSPIMKSPVIGAGDIIRSEIKLGSDKGKWMQSVTEKGGLLPDDMISDIIISKLENLEGGFILDGFPRTTNQALRLQGSKSSVDAALKLSLEDGIILERMLGRMVCTGCGEGYNSADIRRDGYDMPPVMPVNKGFCDTCRSCLEQRKDDTPETILHRLKVYAEETAPLVDFYQSLGIFSNWDVKAGINDLPRIVDLVDLDLENRLFYNNSLPWKNEKYIENKLRSGSH